MSTAFGKLDLEDGGLHARKLTKAQQRSVASLWRQSSTPRQSYREFRRQVMPLIGMYNDLWGGTVVVPFAGMMVIIEESGFTYV